MARMPDHPKPVAGAAEYWADHKSVCMKDTDGHYTVIDTKANELAAAKSACSWQKRENAAVEKERKRIAKNA